MNFAGRLGVSFVALASALGVVGASAPASAQTQETAEHSFNIPPGDMTSALQAFATQTDRNVLFTPEMVAGKTSPGVRGQMSERQALEALLAGSGLSFNQTGAGYAVRGAEVPTQLGAARADNAAPSEVIVVTGTRLRGTGNPTSPTLSYSRQNIEDTGTTSTQDFIRTIPQNFVGGSAGGSLDGQLGAGFNRATNLNAASGVNLRGLGASSSLVLLNSHRVAVSGNGGLVDVSLFPVDAIERVELVTDGSSAIYGSDAIGGVANFILRDRYEGAESFARYGGAAGGLSETVAGHTQGVAWDEGAALLSLTYRSRTDLETSDRDFTAAVRDPTDIFPREEQFSAIASFNQQLTSALDFSADVLYGKKFIGQDLNFAGAASGASSNKSDTYLTSIYAALGYDAGNDWRFEASVLDSHNSLKFRVVDQFPLPGYINGTPYARNEARLTEVSLSGDGPLFTLPGGPVRAAIGTAFRAEDYSNFAFALNDERASQREVSSAYVELNVPIIGEANASPFAQHLDLSLAARYDDYSDFGGTTNPKIGLFWAVNDALSFRTAYSTSFRAPDGSEQAAQAAANFAIATRFPTSSGLVPILLLSGASPDLDPEEAEGFTAGATFTPSFLPRTKLEIGYYDVHFENRIISPPFNATALSNPGYASLVTRFTSDAEAAAFLAQQVAGGARFIDALGTGTTGLRNAVDFRLQNTASLDQSGIDVALSHSLTVGENAFDLRANLTFINGIDTAFAAGAPEIDIADTTGNPTDFRGRLDATWSRGPMRTNFAINYVDGYTDTTAAPAGTVDSWTTFDATVRLAPESWHGISADLSISNITDEDPPLVAGGGVLSSGIRYDGANASPRGRFTSIQLRKRW